MSFGARNVTVTTSSILLPPPSSLPPLSSTTAAVDLVSAAGINPPAAPTSTEAGDAAAAEFSPGSGSGSGSGSQQPPSSPPPSPPSPSPSPPPSSPPSPPPSLLPSPLNPPPPILVSSPPASATPTLPPAPIPSPSASPTEASFPASTGSTSTQIPRPSTIPPSPSSSDASPSLLATPPSSNSSNSSSPEINPTQNTGPTSVSLLPTPPPPNGASSGASNTAPPAAGISSKSSNTAPLVGGIVGGCSGLLIILALVLLYLRRQKKKGNIDDGGAVSGGTESKYYEFDRDIGPTPRLARIKAAIDWKLDRALDTLSNARPRATPTEESSSANAARGNGQFLEPYQNNTGSPQRSGISKARIGGWNLGFGKRNKEPISTPELRSVSVGPPIIPPFSPHSGIISSSTVDFSQLLRMEEQDRQVQQERDGMEREPTRAPPGTDGVDIPPSSARQSYSSQFGPTTPQRASINPYSHRRSSTVGVASWYERERGGRFRSDPFDLEGFSEFRLGDSQELDGRSSILRQSGSLGRPGTAASGWARESRASQYSMGSYYQERQRDSTWTDDRRWSSGSAPIDTAPGIAF
ncbi:MAG: hypothetical protein M1839_000089 [Geoglossum umbratile]|nr:MAG: hypothetical protein M1839_000089 [Geoglossum umbratile]